MLGLAMEMMILGISSASADQDMVRHFVSIPSIMLLARWGSNTILRHLREAPLNNLTAEYKAGVNKTLDAVTVDRDEHIENMSDEALANLKKMETKIREQEAALRALAD